MPDNNFQMFIINRSAFRQINFLNFFDNITLHGPSAAKPEQFFKIQVALAKLIAFLNRVINLEEYFGRSRNGIFKNFRFFQSAAFRFHLDNFERPLFFNDIYYSVFLRHKGVSLRRTDLKKFLYSRQTMGNIRARHASGMKSSHSQLSARFADGLSGHNAYRFANFY